MTAAQIDTTAKVPVDRQCELLALPRSTYYRYKQPAPSRSAEEQDFIDALYRLCLTKRMYGYRRICVELRKIYGKVNRKRVQRLMRQEGLCVVPRRRFIHTTDSKHNYFIYKNLIKNKDLTGINQVWVSDITYIECGNRFAYLAIILDAASRKVIGWQVSQHIDTNLTLDALRMALATRHVPEGLIHHSDRGVQYAAYAYTDLLIENEIQISMSAKGNPYDNAKAESFMKTIKNEEIYWNEYETIGEIEESMECYIETYNNTRVHSSIGNQSPVEYEQQITKSVQQQKAIRNTKSTVSF